MALTKKQIQEMEELTSGAYSFDRYGAKAWKKAIVLLDKQGYSRPEIKWVLESKKMRFAADQFSRQVKEVDKCDGTEIIKLLIKDSIRIENWFLDENEALFKDLDAEKFNDKLDDELKSKAPNRKVKI